MELDPGGGGRKSGVDVRVRSSEVDSRRRKMNLFSFWILWRAIYFRLSRAGQPSDF